MRIQNKRRSWLLMEDKSGPEKAAWMIIAAIERARG